MTGLNPLKGFRDLYPEEKGVQNFIFEKIRSVARLLGYEEYDGPIVESMDLYANKSSKELLERQTFQITSKKGNPLVLRPEMTPSLARMVANKASDLTLPIKLFNIGPRFRYEAPQKGRSREFYQADFDILGTNSIVSDAESIYTIINIFLALGAIEKDFIVYINSRVEMEKYLLDLGFKKEQLKPLLNAIDKQDKLQKEEFVELLLEIEKNKERVKSLITFLNTKTVEKSPYFLKLFSLLDTYGVSKYCQINYNITRGLDYYTGIVFEVREKTKDEGGFELKRALLGGGRYDNLVSDLNKKLNIPGIGFALSDVVLIEFLQNKKLLPTDIIKPVSCLISVFNKETLNKSIEISNFLRRKGISCELYQDENTKLDKQLKFADKKEIPFVLIIGPSEIKINKVKLKNMKTGEQKDLSKEDLLKILNIKFQVTNKF